MFLAHIGAGRTMTLLLLSAGAAIVVTNRRARGRERQAQLQHAAYELGRAVALGRTRAEAA